MTMKNKTFFFLIVFFFALVQDLNSQRRGGGYTRPNVNTETNTSKTGTDVYSETKPNFDVEYSEAQRLIETSGHPFNSEYEDENAKIYITSIEGEIYAITNYAGSNTKVTSPNDVYGSSIQDLSQNLGLQYNTNRTIYIDEKILASNNPIGGFEHFSNIFIVSAKNELHKVHTITFNDNSTQHVVEFKPNCFVSIKKRYSKFLNYIYNNNLLFDEIEVVSLVENSSTNDYLKGNLPNNSRAISCRTEEEFSNLLKQSKHKTIFLLGHIEKGSFVNYSANGERIFSVDLHRIKELSKNLKINIFPLGCNSADYTKTSGSLLAFNSYEAAELLQQGIKTQNLGTCIETLASDGKLQILIDEETFIDQKYGKYKRVLVLKKVGANYIIVGILAILEFPEDDDENDWFSWILYKVKKNLTFWLLLAAMPLFLLFLKYIDKLPSGIVGIIILFAYPIALPYFAAKMFIPNITLLPFSIAMAVICGLAHLILPKKSNNKIIGRLSEYSGYAMWIFGIFAGLFIAGIILDALKQM
jgi:hypothetical protein